MVTDRPISDHHSATAEVRTPVIRHLSFSRKRKESASTSLAWGCPVMTCALRFRALALDSLQVAENGRHWQWHPGERGVSARMLQFHVCVLHESAAFKLAMQEHCE